MTNWLLHNLGFCRNTLVHWTWEWSSHLNMRKKGGQGTWLWTRNLSIWDLTSTLRRNHFLANLRVSSCQSRIFSFVVPKRTETSGIKRLLTQPFCSLTVPHPHLPRILPKFPNTSKSLPHTHLMSTAMRIRSLNTSDSLRWSLFLTVNCSKQSKNSDAPGAAAEGMFLRAPATPLNVQLIRRRRE